MAGTNVASGNSFVATVDALKSVLGGDERWITVSGISAAFKVDPKEEGGISTHTRFMLGPLSYTDLVLTRAVDEKSTKLINWFASHANKVVPGTASVRILRPDGKLLHTFSFSNVVPTNYKGPDLGVDKGTAIATESITFKHHGFADNLTGMSGGAPAAPASTI